MRLPQAVSVLGAALLSMLLTGCDVDIFGFDARPLVGDYKLLVWENGKYSLIADSGDGCGVLNGTVTRIGWNDRVILAEQETCGGKTGRSGWKVVDVKMHVIEGPIDPAAIRTRSELADLKVMPAEAAWRSLRIR